MYTHVLNQSLQFVEYVVHLRFKLCCFRVGWTITILLYNIAVQHTVDKISADLARRAVPLR